MRIALSISLVLLILLQSFSKVWIVLSFKLNREYIASTFCVNRDKPELLCSGKCFLNQQLKADEEQDKKTVPQKAAKNQETGYVLENTSACAFLLTTPAALLHNTLPFFQSPHHTHPCLDGVFHPPDFFLLS